MSKLFDDHDPDGKPTPRLMDYLNYLEFEAVPALVAAGIPRARAWTIAAEGVIRKINQAYDARARRVLARRGEGTR